MRGISEHTLSNMMPPCRIQWVIRFPVDTQAVCITRTVLVAKRRTKLGLLIQVGIFVYITPPPVPRAVIPVHSTLELVQYATHV